MRVDDRCIRLNGLRIRYREWGAPAAAPLVLLHGGSAHAHWWDFFAPAMAATYRVLAVDLRGHGESDHAVPAAYRISDYAADLAAFSDALALARFDLLGHSLGGMVAATYARSAPERVKSLVIVDNQLKVSTAGARYMLRLRNYPSPVYSDRDQAIRRFRLLPTPTHAAPEILAHVAAHGLRELADGRWTLKFDRASLADTEPMDLLPMLEGLGCPILFVRGAHSTLLPQARLLAMLAALPQASSVEIADAYHHVMLDNPAAFERAIRDFLRGT